MSGFNWEKQMGKVTIEHVQVETEKPFVDVAAALEARTGRFDQAVYEELRSGADPVAVRTRLEAATISTPGPSRRAQPCRIGWSATSVRCTNTSNTRGW
jgi:hypothetical protein